MGGFTGLFDRPDPTGTHITKNPQIQRGINAMIGDWTSARTATQSGLSDYIRDYLANQTNAEKYTGQESDVISSFYNGNMANQLAGLRTRRAAAVNSAADVATQQALRNVNLSRVGGQGGGGSYDRRLAMGAVIPIRTQAALDQSNQERSDLDYLTGNQIALTGARTGLADRLAARRLVPGQASMAALGAESSGLGPIISQDQANNFYGIKQEPGLLDRMQQETQFLQGLQSIMKNQYGTASEAYGGWAGMGGGGGGMGGGMGGMTFRAGGPVMGYDYTRGGGVHGPGTGTSDSIPARLSNGEYVIPARAVRIPGVLPLLEKIRKMGGEGPTTQESAGMASGGLYYADSFGDLGHQALARDQFNEATVSSQTAAIQQQGQFNADQALRQRQLDQQGQQNTRSQTDANNRAALNYYSMRSQGQTTNAPVPIGQDVDWGGEMTFARGGYVHLSPNRPYMPGYRVSDSIPYGDRARATALLRSGEFARSNPEPGTFKGHFAEGGMVHPYNFDSSYRDGGYVMLHPGHAMGYDYAHGGLVGYADGGSVLPMGQQDLLAYEQSRDNLAAAVADARKRAGAGNTVTQADVETQRMELERRRQNSAEQYQKFLMEQGNPASQRAMQFRDTALLQAAREGISPDDQPDISKGASPEAVALARQQALAVRPQMEAGRNRSVAIANLLNQQQDLQAEQEQITKNPPPGKSLHFNFSAAEGERQAEQAERVRGSYAARLERNQKELAATNTQIKQLGKEAEQTAYFDPLSKRYVPMVPEVKWKTEALRTPTTSGTGNAGFEASEFQPYTPKYSQAFYNRVNQLVAGGSTPADAKAQALQEMNQAR